MRYIFFISDIFLYSHLSNMDWTTHTQTHFDYIYRNAAITNRSQERRHQSGLEIPWGGCDRNIFELL